MGRGVGRPVKAEPLRPDIGFLWIQDLSSVDLPSVFVESTDFEVRLPWILNLFFHSLAK